MSSFSSESTTLNSTTPSFTSFPAASPSSSSSYSSFFNDSNVGTFLDGDQEWSFAHLDHPTREAPASSSGRAVSSPSDITLSAGSSSPPTETMRRRFSRDRPGNNEAVYFHVDNTIARRARLEMLNELRHEIASAFREYAGEYPYGLSESWACNEAALFIVGPALASPPASVDSFLLSSASVQVGEEGAGSPGPVGPWQRLPSEEEGEEDDDRRERRSSQSSHLLEDFLTPSTTRSPSSSLSSSLSSSSSSSSSPSPPARGRRPASRIFNAVIVETYDDLEMQALLREEHPWSTPPPDPTTISVVEENEDGWAALDVPVQHQEAHGQADTPAPVCRLRRRGAIRRRRR